MLTQSSPRAVHLYQLLVLALICSLAAGPAIAAKGKGPYKEGVKAEAAGDWDRAVTLYDQAVQQDRKNPQYL
jgi:hypothetical protein